MAIQWTIGADSLMDVLMEGIATTSVILSGATAQNIRSTTTKERDAKTCKNMFLNQPLYTALDNDNCTESLGE